MSWIRFTFLCLAVVFLGTLGRCYLSESTPTTHVSSEETPAEHKETVATVTEDKPAVALTESEHQSEQLEPLELPPHWYERDETLDQRIDALADKAPSVSPACAATSGVNPEISVRENISQRLSVRMDETLPRQELFTERTLFWKENDYYYQMTAVWERDMPASYRIEFYRSDSPDFDGNVVPAEPPPGMPEHIDAIAASQVLEQGFAQSVDGSAEMGADILVSRVSERDDGGLHELTTMNGAMISWSFQQGACAVNRELTAIDCICREDDGNHPHIH